VASHPARAGVRARVRVLLVRRAPAAGLTCPLGPSLTVGRVRGSLPGTEPGQAAGLRNHPEPLEPPRSIGVIEVTYPQDTGGARGSDSHAASNGGASQEHFPVTPISVVYGHVRVAQAGSWAEARTLLREHVDELYDRIPGDIARQTQERVQGRVALAPVDDDGWLWVSDVRKTAHYAREGAHGLTTGDLCIVHEFTNGSRNWWTVDVKAKIVSVGPVGVTVRITGESVQFDRYSTVTVPLSFIRPRAKGAR
jgi:hypothetical protein